jgi:hypothetical protein
MASELTVQTLRGPTSGANADTVLIPSGQTRHAPGHIIQTVSNSVDHSIQFSNLTTSNTVSATNLLSCAITPKLDNSQIMITTYVQWSVEGAGGDDWGMVLQRGNTTILGESVMGYWVSGGGVDSASSIAQGAGLSNPKYYVRTATKSDIDKTRPAGTSEISYYIRHKAGQATGGQVIWYGRDGWGGSSNYESQRSKMTMILQEIAQ